MKLRLLVALAAVGTAVGIFPEGAAAHALQGRSDLAVPDWLIGWAAAVVLVISFVALAALWREPKLEPVRWRPLPPALSRVLTSGVVEAACGLFGVFLLGVVLWSGFAGEQSPVDNFAPTFVYVVFWLGLVLVSILFGDVFRAFNPWRALGRAAGWAIDRVAGESGPPLAYPQWLGRWPAAAGLFAFAWIELVARDGSTPNVTAGAALIYSAVTFLGMALFGVEAWIGRGEAFSVYFNLFSRLSVFERRNDQVGVRQPLSGLAALEPLPGTVAVLAVMIGATSFDGLREGSLWDGLVPEIEAFFSDLGASSGLANELAFGVGLVVCVAFVAGFYQLGIAGVRRISGSRDERLAARFADSLVPIALAYVSAHYLTLLLFQGQAIAYLASNPLGQGWNLFGTAGWSIDYRLIGATTVWYLQVAFVVAGHGLALALAHDRSLVLFDRASVAIRSQYVMLGVMVGFTSLALWLLSGAYT